MKKILISVFILLLMTLPGLNVFGQGAHPVYIPIPIKAEQAFDAVQGQKDPVSGESISVALVDVRTRAEYFWVGSACQVDEIITTRNKSIVPDSGKVILKRNGRMLKFSLNGCRRRIPVRKVSEMVLSPIAISIPYMLWDEASASMVPNPVFKNAIEELHHDYEVIILFCRSGGRSGNCLEAFDTDLFEAIYDIDHPEGENGKGGFRGAAYKNVYNGYRGFPGRMTVFQKSPSVSWKDAGLPMKTGINPN